MGVCLELEPTTFPEVTTHRFLSNFPRKFYVDGNVAKEYFGVSLYRGIPWISAWAIISGHFVSGTDMAPCIAIIYRSFTPLRTRSTLYRRPVMGLAWQSEWLAPSLPCYEWHQTWAAIDTIVGWGSVLCEVRGDALETGACRAGNIA